MPQDIKTVSIGTGLNTASGIQTYTESEGEWFIEGFRVVHNGDGDPSTPSFNGGIRPTGETLSQGNLITSFTATENADTEAYNDVNVSEYIDFDTEEALFEVDTDQNGTYDVFIHLRRVL